jgi:hypothetical protein
MDPASAIRAMLGPIMPRRVTEDLVVPLVEKILMAEDLPEGFSLVYDVSMATFPDPGTSSMENPDNPAMVSAVAIFLGIFNEQTGIAAQGTILIQPFGISEEVIQPLVDDAIPRLILQHDDHVREHAHDNVRPLPQHRAPGTAREAAGPLDPPLGVRPPDDRR